MISSVHFSKKTVLEDNNSLIFFDFPTTPEIPKSFNIRRNLAFSFEELLLVQINDGSALH